MPEVNMDVVVNRRIRIEKDLITRVHRSLAGKGTIKVQVGQEVNPSEIIGESQVSAGFRILNLATELSVSPNEVKKYLQRPIGQKIFRGELLAFKSGGMLQTKKIVTAPTDGILEFLDEKSGGR